MNKYIYSVCPNDEFPHFETVMASGIEEAEEKVINKYYEKLEIDDNTDDYIKFQEELNDHDIVISDLYDIEEL